MTYRHLLLWVLKNPNHVWLTIAVSLPHHLITLPALDLFLLLLDEYTRWLWVKPLVD